MIKGNKKAVDLEMTAQQLAKYEALIPLQRQAVKEARAVLSDFREEYASVFIQLRKLEQDVWDHHHSFQGQSWTTCDRCKEDFPRLILSEYSVYEENGYGEMEWDYYGEYCPSCLEERGFTREELVEESENE